MNPIETKENIVAARMSTLIPVLNECIYPEFVGSLTSLIRIEIELAVNEAMNATLADVLQPHDSGYLDDEGRFTPKVVA